MFCWLSVGCVFVAVLFVVSVFAGLFLCVCVSNVGVVSLGVVCVRARVVVSMRAGWLVACVLFVLVLCLLCVWFRVGVSVPGWLLVVCVFVFCVRWLVFVCVLVCCFCVCWFVVCVPLT